jgi:hypothetical protein
VTYYIIPEATIRANIQRSACVAFGSSFAGAQFSAWNDGTLLRPSMVPLALATFVFDAIIQNPDRRSGNPNCLVRGDEFRFLTTNSPSPTT